MALVHISIVPVEVPAARYLSFSETARVVKYAALFWGGCGETALRIRSPVELACTWMCGIFPAATRCSPLAEKVMARTAVAWRMVACRVSFASHIFTVHPAAEAAAPKMEFGLA